MLYEKLRLRALITDAPTDDPDASISTDAELAIANESLVALHVSYTADGTGKALHLYPEVRIVLPGDVELWVPALDAVPDVAGATVDPATGRLPLPYAAPFLVMDGVDGVEVLLTRHIPVPSGDRFRVRVAEDGYDSGHPADVIVAAGAARGAS